MDCYKILNIKEGASLKEIEQAYKDLSSFYNPNNNVSKLAYKKYREIEQAYRILREEKQREIYTLSMKDTIQDKVKVKDIKANLTLEDFSLLKKDNIDNNLYAEVIVDDPYAHYLHLSYDIEYLYYLTNSEYKISFYSKEIINSKGECDSCSGIGKVKENNKA